ncbi:hypothetical protein NKG05_26305 [Oerskovia sp. M15]
MAPDLADEDVDAVADLALELGLDGVIAVNTTIGHDLGLGGLSGPPLLERGSTSSLDSVAARPGRGRHRCRRHLDGRRRPRLPGGGANLVQGYTGMVYNGPFWAASINRSLVRGGAR